MGDPIVSRAAQLLDRFLGGDYDVLARSRRGDSLVHIGSVRAPNIALAKTYALFTYDEEQWAEIAVVPRDCIGWARRLTDAQTPPEEDLP